MEFPSPDWQLPAGVTRSLWDYLHDSAIARSYDECLAESPLLQWDVQFVDRHFNRPGRLIDLGCGTGRLLIPLARRGFWVLGVDLSEEMLKVAGEKAFTAGVSIHRLKANLVELNGMRDQSFDYAACLFSTLGMVSGAGQRQRVVDHVFRLLRPGGKFVLHVHNRWFNVWNSTGRNWLIGDAIKCLFRRVEPGDRVMPVHQGIAGLVLHLFTRSEIIRLLKKAGFRLVECRPISLKADGRLPLPGWFGWLRAYGYLVAVERPG